MNMVLLATAFAAGLAGPVDAGELRSVEVGFKSGRIELAGTILLPAGPGPFPAIVYLHGSGCSTRDDMRHFAEAFVSRGYAGLLFDKRGCGASGGSWTTSSLLDLASDAEAALKELASRPDVDGARLGMWGVSQAGWVAPIAANRSGLARFLIAVTGGGATPRQVEAFGYDQALRRKGLSLEATPGAKELLTAYFAFLDSGMGRAELLDSIDRAKGEPWYDALNLERVLPSEASRPAWEWVATYDPLPDIRKLRVPALVLLGARDEDTPLPESSQRWIDGLREGGSTGSQVIVFPEAGHGLTVGGHHGPGPRATYARGYLPAVDAWLETVTGTPR